MLFSRQDSLDRFYSSNKKVMVVGWLVCMCIVTQSGLSQTHSQEDSEDQAACMLPLQTDVTLVIWLCIIISDNNAEGSTERDGRFMPFSFLHIKILGNRLKNKRNIIKPCMFK